MFAPASWIKSVLPARATAVQLVHCSVVSVVFSQSEWISGDVNRRYEEKQVTITTRNIIWSKKMNALRVHKFQVYSSHSTYSNVRGHFLVHERIKPYWYVYRNKRIFGMLPLIFHSSRWCLIKAAASKIIKPNLWIGKDWWPLYARSLVGLEFLSSLYLFEEVLDLDRPILRENKLPL
jgi:hypothetical protein